MPSFNYPNARYTSNIGFALFGQDEVLAENWLLADQVYGSGSSINVNGTLVTAPNLSSTLPVAPPGEQLATFQFDANGNISAYVPIPAAGGVTSFSGDSVVYNNALSAGAVTLSLIAQAANFVFAGPASAGPTAPTFRALVAADIPSLSGTYLPLAGGTLTGNLLFSLDNAHTIGAVGATRPSIIYAGTSVIAPLFNAATGFQIAGAAPSGHFLVGNGTNYVDATALPSGTVTWNQIGNAAAALSLSNANYATTFNQTSAVPWTWANTTVGTIGSTNASPLLELAANYWATGGATGVDLWTIGTAAIVAGLNGRSNLTFTHTGSTGQAAVQVPLLDIGGTDAGISRLGAASLAIGNGTAGDTTGSLTLGTQSGIGQSGTCVPNLIFGIGANAHLTGFSAYGSGLSGATTGTAVFLALDGYCACVWDIVFGTTLCQTQALGFSGSAYSNRDVSLTRRGTNTLSIGNGTYNDNSCNILAGVYGFGSTATASSADSGISRLGAASLAIGNGTAGDTTGQITATTFTVAASGAAPTSAGTAGTVGQIIANGGKLYFCSATGAAGAATWNTITLVPIL